jgi:hypothetical protein
MHTNHRRKNKQHRCDNKSSSYLPYSLKWYRRKRARQRRAEERARVQQGRYDDLLPYRRDIAWWF